MKGITLVEDDISLCNLLNEYLGRAGFEVEFVHDGPEALKRIARRHSRAGRWQFASENSGQRLPQER